MLVPLATLGTVLVEPATVPQPVKPGLGRARRRAAGPWVMDAELASLVGIVFWIATAVAAFVLPRG